MKPLIVLWNWAKYIVLSGMWLVRMQSLLSGELGSHCACICMCRSPSLAPWSISWGDPQIFTHGEATHTHREHWDSHQTPISDRHLYIHTQNWNCPCTKIKTKKTGYFRKRSQGLGPYHVRELSEWRDFEGMFPNFLTSTYQFKFSQSPWTLIS